MGSKERRAEEMKMQSPAARSAGLTTPMAVIAKIQMAKRRNLSPSRSTGILLPPYSNPTGVLLAFRPGKPRKTT
jgi:hypothetical protein